MNGIFLPDRGSIRFRGRMGALIAVGAGFHPSLTGRENIFINGAILGMTRSEIRARFDAIVDFAEIGDFLDTPVKFYSTGMFVKLGFAIAAQCRPEILLIDEILSVGDLKFQTKCLRFLSESVLNQGTTVVFVSHNRYYVQDLCSQVLYLKDGNMRGFGPAQDVIGQYLDDIARETPAVGSGELAGRTGITDVVFYDSSGGRKSTFVSGETATIRLYYNFPALVEKPFVSLSFFHKDSRFSLVSSTDYLFNVHSGYDGFEVESLEGTGYFELTIESLYLPVGVYTVSSYLYIGGFICLAHKQENAASIEVVSRDPRPIRSLILLPHSWELVRE
jgi:ABC-type polysaccharide/polyol phosphate transport system ATPase subunit